MLFSADFPLNSNIAKLGTHSDTNSDNKEKNIPHSDVETGEREALQNNWGYFSKFLKDVKLRGTVGLFKDTLK